jgi:predicted unusual protein kinase regulating ubiquinone biosynthesis (AarF/ABC1/UbiB family)
MDFLEGCDCFSVGKDNKLIYGTEFFRFTWHCLFVTKYIHTDLHPGNLICMSDGRIGIIDFGMKQEVNDLLRKHLITMTTTGIERDKYPNKKIDILKTITESFEPRLNIELLTQSQYETLNEKMISMFYGVYKGDLDESKFNKGIQIIKDITGQKYIRFNNDLFHMLMSLSMCQATARLFMPDEDDLKRVLKNTLREAME